MRLWRITRSDRRLGIARQGRPPCAGSRHQGQCEPDRHEQPPKTSLIEELAKYGLEAKSADDFLTDIIDLNQARALEAFKELVANRRSPELDAYQVLDQFRKVGLKNTADYLHALL
jgi:hypothetical protein